MRSSPVTRLDQQLGVRAHERHGHRDLGAVGQDELRTAVELLDDAEDVVPPARVQPARMVAKLIQNLFHLEGRKDRFDQDGGANRPSRDSELVLRQIENIVPEARLEMAFELREVEVRAASLFQQTLDVVKEVEAEVEE